MKDSAKTTICFSESCGGQYKNYKNLMDLCSHRHGFGFSAEWVLFQQAIENILVMALMEQLKRHIFKRKLQRCLNNQILDYKAILDLCENRMMSINFFRIYKKSLITVENIEI